MAECGKPTRRTLRMPGCSSDGGGDDDPADCRRSYYVYVPPHLCGGGGTAPDATTPDADVDDVLPLVFAFHCLGCTARTMMHWTTTLADPYGFVLVIPEGLHSSFNARPCCGYAMQHDVDDLGLVGGIIGRLVDGGDGGAGGVDGDGDGDGAVDSLLLPPRVRVSRDVVYAAGWSNGGYMATYAARYFRAVSPISGHVLPATTDYPDVGGGNENGDDKDNNNNRPVGLFMHHSTDDTVVRMTGCCTDPNQPRCCCGISTQKAGAPEQCTDAMQVLKVWAGEINGCGKGGGGGVGGDGGGEEGESSSQVQVVVSMDDPVRGITCHTASPNRCSANATLCVHHSGKSGHFNSPSFDAAFPMTDDVGNFFAEDACSVRGGVWSRDGRVCTCPDGGGGAGGTSSAPLPSGGRYCLQVGASAAGGASAREGGSAHAAADANANANGGRSSSSSSLFVTMCISLFVLAIAVQVVAATRRRKKWRSRYMGWDKVATSDDDEDEDDVAGTEMHDRSNRAV